MTIKITPIEGAHIITKADVEKQQNPENISKITDEQWEEAINIAQNAENLLIYLEKKLPSIYPSFRKDVLSVFYNHYPEMVDLNTANLEELYEILIDYTLELMPSRFVYVTGEVKAVKSELDWEKNKSENLDELLNITKEESEKIDHTAPTGFVFDIARLKDAFVRQKGKKPEELKFTHEEADALIEGFLDGSDLRKKNAVITKELYHIVVGFIMDTHLFNISHFSNDEILSLRHRFIQDIYDFMSDIINKVNSFLYPDKTRLELPKSE